MISETIHEHEGCPKGSTMTLTFPYRDEAAQEAQRAAAAEVAEINARPMNPNAALDEEQDRDLDDDVPNADDIEGEAWSDDDGFVPDMDDVDGLTTAGIGHDDFGADGVDVVGDVGFDQGGDLDDEVPDAEEGSYEHTDTDVEDESSDDGNVVQGRAIGNVNVTPIGGGSGLTRAGPMLGTFDTRTGELVGRAGVNPMSSVNPMGGGRFGSVARGSGVGVPSGRWRVETPPAGGAGMGMMGEGSSLLSSSIFRSSPTSERRAEQSMRELERAQRRN